MMILTNSHQIVWQFISGEVGSFYYRCAMITSHTKGEKIVKSC